ncbi:MAG TPA: GNA1162 family protein, partial [Stellaceae bacterium]
RLAASVLVCGMLAACVAQPTKNYTAFRAADPHSILVVPPVNRSVYVNAPDYFLSAIAPAIAERGYYVFPINMVKRVLEDDGLADADLVHHADPQQLGEMFGAETVLYVTIERWDSQYALVATTTTVEFSYQLKDAHTGQELWRAKETAVYQPSSGGGGIAGLVAQAIVSAIEKADPNYMPLVKQANAFAVSRKHSGLPAGPHAADYKKDGSDF